MAVIKNGAITSNMMITTGEESMIQDLINISRILEKYKNVRSLGAALYLIDGYLEELDEMEDE